MSAQAEPSPGGPMDACSLCGTPVAVGALRCPSCGMHQSMGPERPSPFTAASLWALAGLLAAVYAITLVVVAAAR